MTGEAEPTITTPNTQSTPTSPAMPRRVPIRATRAPGDRPAGRDGRSRPAGAAPPERAGRRSGVPELEGWRPRVAVRAVAARSATGPPCPAGGPTGRVAPPGHPVHPLSLPHPPGQVVEPCLGGADRRGAAANGCPARWHHTLCTV